MEERIIMSGLYCFDCHCWRNKFASTVTREFVEKGKKIVKIVGHRCIKCTRKKYVENVETGFGRGWRVNFRSFIMAIQEQQKRLKSPPIPTEDYRPSVSVPEKKEGFGSKIMKFFGGNKT